MWRPALTFYAVIDVFSGLLATSRVTSCDLYESYCMYVLLYPGKPLLPCRAYSRRGSCLGPSSSFSWFFFCTVRLATRLSLSAVDDETFSSFFSSFPIRVQPQRILICLISLTYISSENSEPIFSCLKRKIRITFGVVVVLERGFAESDEVMLPVPLLTGVANFIQSLPAMKRFVRIW